MFFRASSASRFYRTLEIVCAFLVCSYIFFDVLDLDGSNFARLLAPVDRSLLVAEATASLEVWDASLITAPWTKVSPSLTDVFRRQNHPLLQIAVSRIAVARSHGYRVGLPRDSVPD